MRTTHNEKRENIMQLRREETVRRQRVIRGQRKGEGGRCSEFLSSLPPDSIQLNFEITP